MKMERHSCVIKFRLGYSTVGLLLGVVAGVFFLIQYQNYNACVWGIGSAIAAFLALCVTIAFMRGVWDSNPERLKVFMLTGCFIQLAGVCGLVAYLVLAISQHQGLDAHGEGFYVTSVWCFMTWKWGFLLLIYARSFLRTYQLRQDLLAIIDGEKRQRQSQYNTFQGNNYS